MYNEKGLVKNRYIYNTPNVKGSAEDDDFIKIDIQAKEKPLSTLQNDLKSEIDDDNDRKAKNLFFHGNFTKGLINGDVKFY